MRYSVRMSLSIGFGLIIGLFLIAALFNWWSLGQVLKIKQHKNALDSAKLQSYLILSEIQKQHIHQLQAVFLFNKMRLSIYQMSHNFVLTKLQDLKKSCAPFDVLSLIKEIEKAIKEEQNYFSSQILPVVLEKQKRIENQQQNSYSILEQLNTQVRVKIFNLNSFLEHQIEVSHQRSEKLLAYTQMANFIMLFIAFICAIGIGFALVRMIGIPIQQLHQIFKAFGSGQLEARVLPKGPHELQEVSKSFNRMADDLVELKDQFVENERMAVMGEISAGVAHELNNPLGVMLGYSKLLKKSCELNKEAIEDIKIIEDEIALCQEIVQGLLELARPLQLKQQEIDVESLVQEIVSRFKVVRSNPKIQIQIKSDGDFFVAFIDDFAIRRLITNLLTNAFDATEGVGKIEIYMEEKENEILMFVADSGSGVAPEIQNEIFKPFKTNKSKGTGLGLAICQSIVKAHHGTIAVVSSWLEGACFLISLPKAEKLTTKVMP